MNAAAGRPRSAQADSAILAAATEVFCEVGYEGLSMECVASRAGVGKTTIYRRYPTKLDLVIAVSHALGDGMVPKPDTGSVRADLVAIAQGYTRMLTQSTSGKAIPMMLAAKSRDPELARAHESFVAQRRQLVASVVQRGIDRGELPPGTDPMLITDLVTGALFQRVLVTGQPVTDAYVEAMVDQVLGFDGV